MLCTSPGHLGSEDVGALSSATLDCDVCGKPFTEDLEWIDAKRRQTSAFEMHIYERGKHKTPRKQVAVQEGLNEAIVLGIFKRQASGV